ncbi:MAG: chemotaxis-specific protein-glutamate methyltransferase CheB [Lachnospiraceae bacterium]|nr:chemotaxis-specific protein-glutamate methyltransferase CheB [Lachnospiraceae bacterium]
MDVKKILIVDDSALTRRVLCDIINNDGRYKVEGMANNGLEALKVLEEKSFDGIITDINMPKMNGLEFLKELKTRKREERVMVLSTETSEGARVTLDALELGAVDFIQKPQSAIYSKDQDFVKRFFEILEAVVFSNRKASSGIYRNTVVLRPGGLVVKVDNTRVPREGKGNKLVAIASSTGGPKALQSVIPRLPKNLDAPVLIVQHMPVGFTKSLADRLNSMSELTVTEAVEGESLEKGHVYISKGGAHMKYEESGGRGRIIYTDEPSREGVKPCANYMYESLVGSVFHSIVCVVLTGMGKDGTEGIVNLSKAKKLHIIAEDEKSCVVNGMPGSVVATGLVNEVVDLDNVAQAILANVGVR